MRIDVCMLCSNKYVYISNMLICTSLQPIWYISWSRKVKICIMTSSPSNASYNQPQLHWQKSDPASFHPGWTSGCPQYVWDHEATQSSWGKCTEVLHPSNSEHTNEQPLVPNQPREGHPGHQTSQLDCWRFVLSYLLCCTFRNTISTFWQRVIVICNCNTL